MTIIAGPAARRDLRDIAATLTRLLPAIGAPDWLRPGIACEFTLAEGDARQAEAVAREAIGEASVDVVVQPALGRRKRVLVADLESTIIENEMLDELGDFVGLRDHVAGI